MPTKKELEKENEKLKGQIRNLTGQIRSAREGKLRSDSRRREVLTRMSRARQQVGGGGCCCFLMAILVPGILGSIGAIAAGIVALCGGLT